MLACLVFTTCGALLGPRSQIRSTRAGPIACTEESSALAVLGGTLTRVASTREQKLWTKMGNAWVLAPPDGIAWGAVHFVGGAGFGAAPQLVYDELLTTVARRCGVVVIATPYDVSLNHWKLSERVMSDCARALEEVQSTLGLPSGAPIFRLGHSLGAKLLVLGALAESPLRAIQSSDDAGSSSPPEETTAPEEGEPERAPLGLVGFNNFDLSDSASLAASFIAKAQGGAQGAATAKNVLDALGFVQQFARAAGTAVDVSPSPLELEARVAARFATRPLSIWRFDGDELDSSEELLEALPDSTARGASVTSLQGGHLSPVFFRLDPSDLDPALALLLGGVGGGFTVGSAAELEPLCDAVCAWVWPSSMKPLPLLAESASDD